VTTVSNAYNQRKQHWIRTVARKSSGEVLGVCAVGLDIIKIDKNSTDLGFYTSIWKDLELGFGVTSTTKPPVATGLHRIRWNEYLDSQVNFISAKRTSLGVPFFAILIIVRMHSGLSRTEFTLNVT